MQPRVQFATTPGGSRIAYTTAGEGHALFWLPHFLASHVQLEWDFPQRYVYTRLAERLRVVRFDCRGLGLSDREDPDLSLEGRMTDLTAVAEKLGLATFALAGIEGGGNLAASYAAAHPERVSHLVLINWNPRFDEQNAVERLRTLGILMRRDWELFTENIGTSSFGFDTPLAAGYAKLVRNTVTQETAIAYSDQLSSEDITPMLSSVRCETLVLHSEKNSYAAESSARMATAAIPAASMVVFEGGLPNHIAALLTTMLDFVAPPQVDQRAAESDPTAGQPPPVAMIAGLTNREIEILTLLARGLSNREMADQLVLSPRTVERHLENLYRKTGMRNRAEATAFAYTHNLIERTP